MGLLHRDEPVTDATVNCPRCRAIDWVVRTPRLGGQGRIVCRACGHEHGPYFPIGWSDEPDEKLLERGRRNLARATFPVYVPAGLPWEPTGWFAEDEISSLTVACEEPWVSVTTEPHAHATEEPEALRDAMMDVLGDEGPGRSGRSPAAWLLEVEQEDARIEALVDDLSIEGGTLRVEGAIVPCRLLRSGDAWAAYARLAEVVVIPAAVGVPMADVELVRAT